MGKSKNNSRSEIEFLRGRVRQLEKALKQAEKNNYSVREVDDFQEEQEVINTKASCPQCHEGEIKLLLALDNKDYFSCTYCDFRKVVKK